jgi:hypothetical protein
MRALVERVASAVIGAGLLVLYAVVVAYCTVRGHEFDKTGATEWIRTGRAIRCNRCLRQFVPFEGMR